MALSVLKEKGFYPVVMSYKKADVKLKLISLSCCDLLHCFLIRNRTLELLTRINLCAHKITTYICVKIVQYNRRYNHNSVKQSLSQLDIESVSLFIHISVLIYPSMNPFIRPSVNLLLLSSYLFFNCLLTNVTLSIINNCLLEGKYKLLI